jgi:transcriptional regulator
MSTEESRSGILQGTLDLMVLRTLETMGPQHGFGLAKRIQQISGGALDLNQGTLYPALLRLEQRGWIESHWGASEANRRAKFYQITRKGRKQVQKESAEWARTVALMDRFVRLADQE